MYIEFARTNGYVYVGLQRPWTRTGNYEGGTGANGNGGDGVFIKSSVWNTAQYLSIDLDLQTYSLNGAAAASIPGTGYLKSSAHSADPFSQRKTCV